MAAGLGLLGLSVPPTARAGDPPPFEVLSVTTRQDQDGLARDLPSSLSLWSLLETVEPAAILDRIDGAGLHLGEPGRFAMRGTSWTQNAFVLDGVSLTDPGRGGTPLWMADLGPLEAIDVTSALAPVEDAAPGVTLSLRPRTPAGSWRGTAQGYGLGAGLQASGPEGPPFPVARFGSLFDASVVAGGPLSGDTLGVLLSGHVARASRLEGGDPTTLEARLVSGALAVTYDPNEHDQLRLLAAGQAMARPSPARARYTGDPQEDVRALGTVLRWTRTGGGTAASGFVGLWSGRFSSDAAGLDPSRPVERLRDGPVADLVLPARSDRSSFTAGGSLAPRGGVVFGLRHAPRLGVVLHRAWTGDQPGPDSEIPETVDGLPARVFDYRSPGPASHRHVLDLSAWAADRLAWGDRLLVEVGLRLETTTGDASGAARGASWTSIVPRVAARLRLTDAGRVTLFGGFGEYTHRLLLDPLAFGDPNAPWASVYRWTDTNGDGRYQPEERGVLVARDGPGSADGSLSVVDPGLRPPRTREVVAGIQASPGAGLVLTLLGIDRRERDLLDSVNVGVTGDDYVVRYLPDPGGDIVGSQDDQLLPIYDRRPESFGHDRFVLANPPGGTSRYQGLEVRIEKAAGERFLFQAGATAFRTELAGTNRNFRVTENDQGLPGELYDDPNADTYARGRGFFDRAFTIKLAGAWRGPGDLRLGLVARYQDGQPFARLVVVPDLAQGPEAVPATTRGQTLGRVFNTGPDGRPLTAEGHRFTYTLTLDARVEKGFRLGSRRLGLVAEAFNLLGTRNEVEEDPVWGPDFRDPVLVQPPRVFRLGARFDF